STLPEGLNLPEGLADRLKREAFRAIVAEERPRLKEIQALFDSIERELLRGEGRGPARRT
ncbi:MAG TPA: hypothetical protein VF652_06920, partial [Allosphingosinicella sp.]